MGIEDKKAAKGETGEKEPKGVISSDKSGDRKVSMTGGVGIGKADKTGVALHGVGRDGFGSFEGHKGEFNTGSKEHEAYTHKREAHDQDGM